ncbi:MAG: polysaccharide biosynthesis/export family protein [Cyanophyceae cyanobacterium]
MMFNLRQRVALSLASFLASSPGLGALAVIGEPSVAQTPPTVPTLEPPSSIEQPPQPAPLVPLPTAPDSSPPETFSPINPPPRGFEPEPFEETILNEFTIYRLDVGDAIAVRVEDFPEFNFNSVVDLDGNVIVPVLGEVSVLGLTLEEVETKLAFELNRAFLRERPEVIATLSGVRPVEVTIAGEVVRPGFYTVGPASRLNQVLTVAGGSTEKADLRRIIVRRPLPDGSTIETSVDLYTPLQSATSLPFVRLQGGDTIIVSRLEVGADEDYDTTLIARSNLPQQQIRVRVLVPARTGTALRSVALQSGSTFLDVVASLPSQEPLLVDRDVALLRFDPERGQIVTQELDAEAAIKGDVSQDVPLRDEDLIVVSRTLLGEIFNAFDTITRPIRTFFGFRRFIENIVD